MIRADLITYNYDKQCVTWFDHYYTREMVYLIGFLVFWVKNEKFKVIVEGQEFIVTIKYDGFSGWFATTDRYDGQEDKINSNWSAVGREDALEGLLEKLSESILEKI